MMAVSSNKPCWACLVALTLLPAAAWGQARSRYVWRDPSIRGIRTIGGDFARYSTGAGTLGRSQSYGGINVLRSSMSAGGFPFLRGSSAAGVTGPTPPSSLIPQAASPTQAYTTVQLKLPGLEADVSRAPEIPTELTAEMMLNLQSYLAVMGHSSTLQAESEEPVTSFVPEEPGRYQQYMKRGDRSFREGQYSTSSDAFELALTLARYSPEAHLSKMHARFAMGQYNSAAYHLQKALTYFPELAMARVRVRGFYARPETFVTQRENLRASAAAPQAGENLWLVLAYLYYFDDAEVEAARALRRAFELAQRNKNEATKGAIQRFWDGMVAANKASGSLGPTTRPAGSGKGSSAPPRQAPTSQPQKQGGSAAGKAGPSGSNQDAAPTGG